MYVIVLFFAQKSARDVPVRVGNGIVQVPVRQTRIHAIVHVTADTLRNPLFLR